MQEQQIVGATAAMETDGADLSNGRISPNGSPSPLLLRTPAAAAMLNTSVRTLRMWDAAGKIPQPIHIGRSTFWRADELRAWVAAGCPRRKDWLLMQS